MDPTGGAAERQHVATAVESALANIDIVSLIATFLEAKDLCQVKATCKSLGSASDDSHEASLNGLSMAEEAAKRIHEDASDEEKAMLPRYDGENWIELYHHLLMLRTRLTFDQLVGSGVEYHGGDKRAVQGRKPNGPPRSSQALCGNHIMRAGKHWATFTSSSSFEDFQTVGVIRPLPGWEKRGLEWFSPVYHNKFHQDLQRERTNRWEGDYANWEGRDDFDRDCTTLGMLLDLGNGTLSVYQSGRRLGTLNDGLAGEYCWIAGFLGGGDFSIQRGYNVNIV
ncbi:hypothetical protein THAOC_10477 [Thalassiosira oceanica]|uniref:F-box domain-containing protein n=1 Tax=Thalassiosira oceanica TaxID=159749 RepID=K0SSG8_THAOC|nr:hypothetical protein THAOC_10477 [Thalassiosira oceanica]|eukprot:EJK68350.1 hypothetical protein THAOC_10477 [Thalassiosira oceanica]